MVHIFNVWTIIMQSLNVKEWKLLELQITQTRHHLSILVRKKCLSLAPLKKRKYAWNMHKIGDAHLQNVNNHYIKFEYKGMKTFGVTDYRN